MKVIYSAESKEDLYNITNFYKNIHISIAKSFKIEIKKLEHLLETSAEIYSPRYGFYRRANLKNFPFCIFFKIDQNNIKIVKIIHQSRDPIFWP